MSPVFREERTAAVVSLDVEQIWSRVEAQLALVVDERTHRIWLQPLRALDLVDERLLIEAPPQTRRWIQGRFGRVIQSAVELVLGPDVEAELVSHGSSLTSKEPSRVAPRERSGERQPSPPAEQPPASIGPLGNPRLTFEQFVIGDCNRLAHAAALTVAELPSQAYNPLFICGPPGVGKTHLLVAIANLLMTHNPGLTVRATTGEAFTNEFLAALSGGHTEAFKARFRDIDVLLLDDVQFLQRKTKTEEEFFHTFNALHDAGRQIVLTSDRPPHDLEALEDRLRERFEAGLVADVQPPDQATRMAILRKRVHQDGVEVPDTTALETIASRVTNNVRALEGALIRVVAFSSLTGRVLSPELAHEVLSGLYPEPRRIGGARPGISEIQDATCRQFGISREELVSAARTPRIAWPRQVAMYLSRELTDASLPSIGREFGGRDHTTVLHACRRAATRLETDETCRDAVENLQRKLSEPPSAPGKTPIDRI
jgi:chromosomal replication initiator protein